MLESEAIRVLLQVLRKWPLFGCDLYSAGMRTSNDRRVWIALSDSAVHILDQRHFVSFKGEEYKECYLFRMLSEPFPFNVFHRLVLFTMISC